MNRLAIGAMMLLVLGPALHARDDPKDKPKNEKADKAAEKPKTPAEQYRQIISEQERARQDFMKAYREAKTDADRQKAFEKYPNPQKVSGRMLEIAEKNPKDDAAVDALVWIAQNASYGTEGNKAVSLLSDKYIENKKVGQACLALINSQSADAEKLMRSVMEKNPDHDAKGMATLALAKYLKHKLEPPGKEVEGLLETVEKDYADVKYSNLKLGEAAQRELFELRNLAIGATAPNIAGEDIDGKKFSLADYRGKVVVLDFWGNW
jgi:AhpC/TSA family